MVKTLVRHGNSYALVIDKPILELLKITPETRLSISTDGRTLRIEPEAPAAEGREAFLRDRLEEINRRYAPALRKLAE